MDNSKKLYDRLSADKLYTKSYDEFVGQFGNAEGQKKLYNSLKEQQVYTKSEQEFSDQFWGGVKKKDQTQSMVSAGPSKTTKPLSASTGQLVSGPSASFGQLGNKLPATEQAPLPVEKEDEEIGVIDDLWNTFKGAGSKTLATLSSIPQFAQTAALDVFMSATGMKSDFNKLPSADKKQIKDALSGILTASSRASGTATQGIAVGANLSQKSYDFLNKKSEDIYKKARQEQVDVVDELSKFKDNPNAESIQKILYQGLKTTVESVPFMVGAAVSLPLMGVASAAGKRQEDLAETGGELGLGYALNAGITGTAEAIFEGTTQKILGKAIKAATGNPVAAKAVAEGFVKSVLKDFNAEGLSEGATTLVQEISDKITKGQPIEFWPLAKKVANSYILGGISSAGISATGSTIGAARKYVAGKLMPKEQKEKIENNIKTIQSLNLEHGDDVDPKVNEVINNKINELVEENKAIVANNEAIANNLTEDQMKQVVEIDNGLNDIYSSAKSILEDVSMDKGAKELLLKDLQTKQNTLKEDKNAISEQAAGQIPVQPEAGGRLQMAEGEPQAEPQVPTQEGQGEEIEKRRQEELARYDERDKNSLEAIMPNNPNHQGVQVGTKFNQGLKITVENTKPDSNYDGREDDYEAITKIIEPAEFDSDGKLSKAAKVEVTIFNTKAEADAAIQANYEKVQSLVGKKQQGINAKYDAELAALPPEAPTQETKTEEVKKEEVEPLKIEDINFGTAFDIQESTAERTVSDKNKWGEAQEYRERIENAGDILRELSSRGDSPDTKYLLEKVNKLKNWISKNGKRPADPIPSDIKTLEDFNKTNLRFTNTLDSYEYLNKFHSDILGKIKKEYEEIPTYTKEQEIALDLVLDLIDNNIDGVKSKLVEIEKISDTVNKNRKLEIIPNIKLSKAAQISETQTPTEEGKVDAAIQANYEKVQSLVGKKQQEINAKYDAQETAFTKLDKGAEAETKFDEVYKKRFEKTKDKLKAFASAKVALLKTDAYAAATRQQRLDVLSYLRNKYKLKMDTNLEATRAQIEVSKQVTADEIVATIKDYLGRAVQEGVKRGTKRTKEFFQEKRKADKKVLTDTIEKIKKMIDKSPLKGAQAKAIINGLKMNLSNEKTMARYMERVDKIIKNVKYAEKLNEANDLKRKIKGLMSARNMASQNQLAKDFLTLSPDLSKNIDKYIQVANSVFDSITRGQRTPAVIADVEAYVSKAQAYEKELIQNTLDDIAEKAKAKLLKDNQNLVDAGVLSKDMTLDQINEYLYSINDLGEGNVKQANEKQKVLLEQAKNVFDALAPIAEIMVSEGIDPFTGEEIEIDKYTKELVNRLLDVDLDKLEGAEAYRLANSLQEFLVNGVVDDLEARLTAYEAIKGAERLQKKGVKSTISTSQFAPLAFISKLWDINVKPLKSLLAKAFSGRIAGTEIFNESGLRGVSLGAARAKKIASTIISKYDKMFKDEKPNGKAFDDASNTYERGIFAFLSRNINRATPEQTNTEFKRRMTLIGETIDNLRDTNKRDLIAMADVIQSIYDKVKDESSVEGIAKFIDPKNQEAVNYWIEEFKKYYPEIKAVARTTYNTILEDDIDYTPDTFFKIIPDETKYDPSGVFKMTSSLVKTKRSGSLLENQRTPSIRDEKDTSSNNLGVSFDFDLNMANTFQKTLVDVKTAPSILYFKNFVNSDAFNKMVPDAEVRKTLKDRMVHYADSIREKDGSNYEDIVKEADAIARRISRYSTQRALGSVSNIVKQTLPIFVNTFVNLNGSGDISLFKAGLRSMADPDVQKAIDESGYPIANRGLESQTTLDSADKLLKKASLNNKKSILDTIDELGQKRLETFLKNPDVYAARSSWISYYLQNQKSKGVDIDRIDWSKPLDSQSANYAEDMVDLQQNTSESSSMGKLFSSKSPNNSLVRQLLFAYASFVMNQKDKVFTDVGILFSNSNKQEKEMAAKSLISTVAEMAAFEFVSMALSEGVMFIASSLVGGDDEDKETMQDRFNRMFKRAYTNTTASLLSPAPLLDKVVIYLLNQGITIGGNLLPRKEEVKKKGDKKKDDKFFYEDKGYAASPVTSALSYIGGAPGVSIRAGMSVFNNAQRIFSSQYQDVFGNDVKFSDKDKMMIAGALVFQILAAGNLLPSEAERIANSVVIEVEKGARKSKKKKWSPM